MSKWSLLKSSLKGKREHDNELSIHCFKGFNDDLVERKKILYTGLMIQFNVCNCIISNNESINNGLPLYAINSLHSMLTICYDYMETKADTTEINVIIIAIGSFISKLIDMINTGLKNDCFRMDYIKTGISNNNDNNYDNDNDDNNTYMLCKIYVKHKLLKPTMNLCNFWSYNLPFHNNTNIITREKNEDASVGISGLLSNKMHGIDNTGNVKVWTSELLLLYILLEKMNQDGDSFKRRKSVLELGGGNTGLCGLGLAITNWCESVMLTDGHPDCVLNQNVCIQMNKQNGNLSSSVNIYSNLLRWSENDTLGDWKRITDDKIGTYDIIIASDCLFFKDFHKDLLWVLTNSLSYDNNSCIYLLQPRRSGTMDLFLDLANEYFDVTISNDYCEKVNELHKHYLTTDSSYNIDIHFPILVILKRK